MKPIAMLFPVILAGVTLGAQEPRVYVNAFEPGGDSQIEVMRMPLSARTVKGAPYPPRRSREHANACDGNRISRRTTGRVSRRSGPNWHEARSADGSQACRSSTPWPASRIRSARGRVAVQTPPRSASR